jgi:hypothetical protein
VRGLSHAIHRLLDAVTDGGRHPDNAALLLVAVLVIGAAAAGWLD